MVVFLWSLNIDVNKYEIKSQMIYKYTYMCVCEWRCNHKNQPNKLIKREQKALEKSLLDVLTFFFFTYE